MVTAIDVSPAWHGAQPVPESRRVTPLRPSRNAWTGSGINNAAARRARRPRPIPTKRGFPRRAMAMAVSLDAGPLCGSVDGHQDVHGCMPIAILRQRRVRHGGLLHAPRIRDVHDAVAELRARDEWLPDRLARLRTAVELADVEVDARHVRPAAHEGVVEIRHVLGIGARPVVVLGTVENAARDRV